VTGPKLRFYRRLGFQMGLAVALMTGLAFGTTTWFLAGHERETLTRELTLRVLSETRSLSLAASTLLLRQDPELGLHPFINKALEERPDLVDLVVLDAAGIVQGHRELVQVGRPHPSSGPPAESIVIERSNEQAWIEGNEIVITRPIVHFDQTIGTLVARASRGGIEASVRDAVRRMAMISALATLLTITLVLILVAQNLAPLNELRGAVQRIGSGELATQLSVTRKNELGMLADLINAMTDGLRQAQAERIQVERLDRELEIARELQATLLPRDVSSSGDVDIAAHYVPALEVSGDYYDVIPLADGTTAVVAADVSGKGVPGLVVMAMLRVILRGLSRPGQSPREVLASANRIISGSMRRGMFVTCLYGVFDPHEHRLRYASAGHCAPAIYGGGSEFRWLPAGGKAMGMFPPAVLEKSLRSHEVTLRPGQGILLYTDGLVEAMDESGQQLGEQPVVEVLEGGVGVSAADLVHRLVTRVDAHRGSRPATDDLTLLILQREFVSSPQTEVVGI
jgi:sigma-B regulation protein RsbU (phosphoserine phosphatase)